MNNQLKQNQEKKSLVNIDDSFKKIIIVGDVSKPRMDEDGIITMVFIISY